MKNLSFMIKPASSACNLRCHYCFYADVAKCRTVPSFGHMSNETMKKILENIRRDLLPGDRINIGFQGGEPTLAGLDFFRAFIQQTQHWDAEIQVHYSLQTNGTMLDDAWCTFLSDHHFLVGLSLDLLPDCHNLARIDTNGDGTYKRVVNAIALLRKHHVAFNVLCTLTDYVARHPAKVWKQIQQLDLDYVQFTPCLDELNSSVKSPYTLTPDRFGSFYTQLFQKWESAFHQGEYRSIKLFDDVVNLLAFGIPTACGIDGVCRPQLVVEADGSTYPCDFYCLDKYKSGNLADQTLQMVFESPVNQMFAKRPHAQPRLCKICPFITICGGNCKRMQGTFCGDNVCGYQMFLTAALPSFQVIARNQRLRLRTKQSI